MTYRLYGRTEKDDSGPLMSTQAVMVLVVQFTVYTLSLMNYYPYTEMVLDRVGYMLAYNIIFQTNT